MTEAIAIPVSYDARSTRHPQTPPQRALLGVEPMSSIARVPSPIATPPLPLLVSSATSSKPRRIALTPATAVGDTPKSPGGSVIQRVSLIAPSSLVRRLSDEASPYTIANSASSTLRAPIRLATIAASVQGHVHPLHSSSLAPNLSRRPSDDPPLAFPFPNSLYKLRDRDIPPSLPHSIRGSISGETTIKAGSMARHMNDLRFILRGMGEASSVETARPPLVEGVDELAVEWCVRCGMAKEREMMELREVADEEGGGTGVWWICREACGSPPHNPSSET